MCAKEHRFVFAVGFAFLAFSAFGQTEPRETDRAKNRAERDVNPAFIKRLYYSMAPLTYPDRAMVYSAQKTSVQMALWQLHFDEFERIYSQLTPEQRQVVNDARLLGRDFAWFRIREGDEGWNEKQVQIDEMRGRGRAVFLIEDYKDAFVRLGPPYVPRPGMPDVPFTGTASCICATYEECQFADEDCMRGDDIGACTPTSTGCGWMGFFGCNGFCF